MRKSKATQQFNMRIPKAMHRELRKLADRKGSSASAVAIAGLTEWLRLSKFPGIDFRWTLSGRHPHITGTGLSVWELLRIWQDHRGDLAALLDHYPNLAAAQVQAGIAYAQAHADEAPADGFGTRPPFAASFRL